MMDITRIRNPENDWANEKLMMKNINENLDIQYDFLPTNKKKKKTMK